MMKLKGKAKLKLPSVIDICGRNYKIKRRKDRGGSFWVQKQLVEIGVGDHPTEEYFWLMHEILEVIMCINDARYASEVWTADFLFSMDHPTFQRIADQLAAAIQKLKSYIPEEVR